MNASWRGGRRAQVALAMVAVVAGSALLFADSAYAAASEPAMAMVVTSDLAVSGDRLSVAAEITDCDNPGFDVPAESVLRLNHGGAEVARSTMRWTQPSPGHWSSTAEFALSTLTMDPGGYGDWLAWTDVAYSPTNTGRCGPLAAFVDFVLVAPTVTTPIIIEASTTTSTTTSITTTSITTTSITTTTTVTTPGTTSISPVSEPPAYTGVVASTTVTTTTLIPNTVVSNTATSLGETITNLSTTTVAFNDVGKGVVNKVVVANAGVANPGPADVLAFTGSNASGSAGLAVLLVGMGAVLVLTGRLALTRRSSGRPRTRR